MLPAVVGLRVRDQPLAAAVGDEADHPAGEDEQPVLEADQVEEVHDQPGDPGEQAAELEALEVGDGLAAADRGEVALVAVVERRRLLPGEAVADGAAGVAALLHRDRRDARQRHDGSVGVAHLDHVADRDHLGMARQRQVGLDRDAAGAVDLDARLARELRPRARRRHARGPDHRARGDPLGLAVGRPDRDRLGVDVDDRRGRSAASRRAARASARAFARERRREAGQDAVGHLDEQDPRRARCRSSGSRGGACRARSRRSAPPSRRPVGPAPTTTNVSQRAPALRVRLGLGRLERGQDPARHVERALERLQLGRERAPLVVAEVRVARAAGDDQAVVGELVRRRRSAAARAARAAPSRSKPVTSAEQDATFRLRLKMPRSGTAISPGESEPVATW